MKKSTTKQQESKGKLNAYLALSGAVVLGGNVGAQIIHTDLDPDELFDQNGEYYDLDLNNDGINDFRIEILNTTNTHVSSSSSFEYNTAAIHIGDNKQNGKNMIARGYDSKKSVKINKKGGPGTAAVFSSSYMINGKSMNMGKGGLLAFKKTVKFNKGGVSGTSSYNGGSWDNVQDKFLGVYFEIDGNYHNGWIRLDVGFDIEKDSLTFTVKDFVYQGIPEFPLHTGRTVNKPAKAVTNVIVTDVSDNYNASDFHLEFTPPHLEGSISRYKVYAVKAEKADDFTAKDVVFSDNEMYSYTPDHRDVYERNLNSITYDTDGDEIVVGKEYKFFVLSYPRYDVSTEAVLSAPSEAISLNVPPKAASQVVIEDVADNNNSSDMKVSFTKAKEEATINEYRILIVEQGGTKSGFGLSTAIAAVNYIAVSPSGNDYSDLFPADTLDVNGDPIRNNKSYNVYVLTQYDNETKEDTPTYDYILSLPSNQLSMEEIPEGIKNLVVKDAIDLGFDRSREIGFSFDVPADTTNISEFRLIIVQDNRSSGNEFNLNDANSTSNYHSITNYTAGSTIVDTVTSSFNDTYGWSIRYGMPYKIFILTVQGGGATENVLSEPQNLTLFEKTEIVKDLLVSDIGTNGNSSDIRIFFDYTDINYRELRILAVKASNAEDFNLSAANMVVRDNSSKVLMDYDLGGGPKGLFSTDLEKGAKDVDGDLIVKDELYKFFVLSIANMEETSENALSEPSNAILFTDVKNELSEFNISAYSTANKIIVSTNNEAWTNANVEVFNITGQQIYQSKLNSSKQELNLSKANEGIYLLRIISEENQVFTKKLFLK